MILRSRIDDQLALSALCALGARLGPGSRAPDDRVVFAIPGQPRSGRRPEAGEGQLGSRRVTNGPSVRLRALRASAVEALDGGVFLAENGETGAS